MIDASRPRAPWMLAGLLLAACSPSTTSPENAMGLDPATAAYQREGYNDKRVDARVGPNRYSIPANYFRDQIGPDFEGNFSLLLQWPDLQPLAPGKGPEQDKEAFAKQIAITPYYVDRVPIETRLEASLEPIASDEASDDRNPGESLDLRDSQPELFGLTPYRVNREKFDAYTQAQGQANARLEDAPDWYLARDADGGIATVIKCGSHLRPDGLVVHGNDVQRDGPRSTSCTHEIVIAQDKVLLSIDYARVFLKDWKQIEQRARDVMAQYRIQ